jgi:hypothetical protein
MLLSLLTEEEKSAGNDEIIAARAVKGSTNA